MDTVKCSYCQKRQLATLMVEIHGLFFCNRGHFREYIREKPIEPLQMDMFQTAPQQPLPTTPSTSMLSCDVHKTFQYQCRNCNPR